MATTTKNISLDFYNNSIVNVYAKQSDANSRFVNITCTDHGKKVFVNKEFISAFIRLKKSDGTYIYDDAQVLDDGTVLVTLTQNMLAADGKHVADIVLISTPDVISEETYNLSQIVDLSNTSVISSMSFYLIVGTSAINDSIITSTNEFSALTKATAECIIITDKCETATEDYNVAISNCKTETSKCKTATTNCNTMTANCKTVTDSCKTSTSNCDAATSACEAATSNCKTEYTRCKDAADEFATIKDFSGIIMKSEKAVANGVATLNSSAYVPQEQVQISRFLRNNLSTSSSGYALDAYQGYILNNLIESLQNSINNLPKIYHGTSAPTSSIGKDGDLYFQIIS